MWREYLKSVLINRSAGEQNCILLIIKLQRDWFTLQNKAGKLKYKESQQQQAKLINPEEVTVFPL